MIELLHLLTMAYHVRRRQAGLRKIIKARSFVEDQGGGQSSRLSKLQLSTFYCEIFEESKIIFEPVPARLGEAEGRNI